MNPTCNKVRNGFNESHSATPFTLLLIINNLNMKKLFIILLKVQKIISICYTIYYLIKTFVIWKFTNPFDWIINIPNYTNDDRGTIIGGIIIIYTFTTIFVYIQKES